MGLFSSIGKGIKGIGHFLGSVASNPITQGIVGLTPLGIPGAILTGALGKLAAPGGNIGSAVGGALSGAAAGAAGQGIRGLLGGSGVKLPGGIADIGKFLGLGGGAGGGLAGFLGGGGLENIAKLGALGLGVADLVNAQTLGKKSSDLANQALGTVQENWNLGAPLRTAGRAGVLNPKIMDLSQLLANSGPYGPGIQLGRPGTVGMGTFTG